MDLRKLEQKLVAAARANPTSDRVPYAFEKRVMNLLRAKPALSLEALWARALWRGAAVCLGVVVVVGALSHFAPRANGSTSDLSQDFEKTMLAAVNQDADYSW